MEDKKRQKRNTILTNLVTALRIVGTAFLIPVFKIYGGFATALLSLGCLGTDFIDGKMARKLKTSTFFGSILDAASDKMFLITSFILLASITPLAFIPAALEVGILAVNSLKLKNNLNVQSNKLGKIKMWVAGVCILASYLFVDQNFWQYFSANLATKMASLDQFKVFSAILTPMVLSDMVTLGKYIQEYHDEKKQVTEEKAKEMTEEKNNQAEALVEELKDASIPQMLFDHDLYEKHKDSGNYGMVLSRKIKRKKER